jgi:hypothetical protein
VSVLKLPLLRGQPMFSTDGYAFKWRNGDASDAATGMKCMIEQAMPQLTLAVQGSVPVGDPQDAEVQTTS